MTAYTVVEPKNSGKLGSVVLNTGPRKDMIGWWFISATSGHGNGRKPWPSPHQAIPRWAQKRGAKLQ